METRKFILLDVDYVTRNGRPVIRLFGKLSDEKRPIMALDKTFKPYIYLLPHNLEEALTDLGQFKIPHIEKKRLNDNGVLKDFLKVTLKHPSDIKHLKKKIEELKSVEAVREHDISYIQKYMINKSLFPLSEVEVQGHILNNPRLPQTLVLEIKKEPRIIPSESPSLNILSFKIETCSPRSIPQVKKDPIVIISFYSNQGFQKVFSTLKSSSQFVETVPNESELINNFFKTIKHENPDIIMGYNSDKFDYPYLQARADHLGTTLPLGVDGSQLKFKRLPKKSGVIKGRVHIDLYRVVRRHLQLTEHTLSNVYRKLFKEEKIDIPQEQIYTSLNDKKKREWLYHYSLEDTKAISQIGDNILPLSIELARLVGQPLFDVTRRGTGNQVEAYLIRKAHEYGYVVPNKFGEFLRNVVGGHVEEPVPGLHENIFYFDFRSLYPSIIIAKNISPDTLTEEDNEECHIAPEFGYKFKKEPRGFIPTVTTEILQERIRIKNLMKETEDPQERQILNFRQQALKTLISTIYGLFNHSTYRWYSIEASEAITAWGREYLKKTMKDAEKHGFQVLYADTDGLYVKIEKDAY